MKYEEAIEILKRNKPTSDPRICGKELCTACDVAIAALEKQVPKKPIKKTGAELGMYYKKWNYYCCPTCGEPVQIDDDELYSTIYYPTCECGQRIKYDWERDEEWKESRNETNR